MFYHITYSHHLDLPTYGKFGRPIPSSENILPSTTVLLGHHLRLHRGAITALRRRVVVVRRAADASRFAYRASRGTRGLAEA